MSRASKKAAKKALKPKQKPLCDLTEDALKGYFRTLNGHRPTALYDLVISEVEKPLLKTALDYVSGNQSHAAEILGINRGTLRKKLRQHGLLNS